MNAAEHVKTPEPKPEPMVWTDERVRRWRDTGEIPGPVMVWTVDQTCTFLDYAKVHAPDIHPMLHLAAYRGPRRADRRQPEGLDRAGPGGRRRSPRIG